jgi:hypothetical protein
MLINFQESNDNLEAALINRSLQQGQEVLSKTKREGTSIADELEMDDSQVKCAFAKTCFGLEMLRTGR